VNTGLTRVNRAFGVARDRARSTIDTHHAGVKDSSYQGEGDKCMTLVGERCFHGLR